MDTTPPILPRIISEATEVPVFVDQTYGEPLFHADGDVVALGYAADGTLWGVDEGGVLRQWAADGALMSRAYLSDSESCWRFAADATRLASGTEDVVLWDVLKGMPLARRESDSWVTVLEFSADAKTLASGHDDGTIRLWSLPDLEPLAMIEANSEPISALEFRADGRQLASAAEDRSIHIWDLPAGTKTCALEGHLDRIPSLAWHPDARALVSAGWDTTARVWHPPAPEPAMLLNSHSDQVHLVAFSPDGRCLACADSDFTIHLWDDVSTGKSRAVLAGHVDEIHALAFSADGKRLASAGADRSVHVWDVLSGKLIAGSAPSHPNVVALAGESVFANPSGFLQGYAIESGDRVSVPQVVSVRSLATSPDGEKLVVSDDSEVVRVFDRTSGAFKRNLTHTRGPIDHLAFSADGTMLATASLKDGLVWVWSDASEEAILVIPEAADSSMVEAVAFHPTQPWLVVGGVDFLSTGGSDGSVCVWDLNTRDKAATFATAVTSLGIDPKGRYAAGGTLKDTVDIWDLKTFELAASLSGHQGRIDAVAFSPQGDWLVTGGEDGTLRIWDLLSMKLVVARQFDSAVESLTFPADGRKLFVGNGNLTVYRLDWAKLLED